MHNTKIDTDMLVGVAVSAGNIIRAANKRLTWSGRLLEKTKPDGTQVTNFDRQINAKFARFAERYGIGFVGEEGNGDVDKRVMLLVDPIDGTGAFALGMNSATVIVTLMAMDGNEGTPLFSIIHEPLRDITWIGQMGQPTRVSSKIHGSRELPVLPQSIPVPWKTNICVFPGAGYRLSAVKAAIENDPARRFLQQDMGAFGISAGLIASGIIHAAAIAPTSAVEAAAMSLIVKGVNGVAIDLNGISLRTFELGQDRNGKVDFLLPHGALFASNGEVSDSIIDIIAAQQGGM